MAVRTWRKLDFSGGLQTAASRILSKGNELAAVKNGEFKTLIGGVTRRLGYTLTQATPRANKPALGAFVHRWNGGSRQYLASNNAGNTATVLSYWNGAAWVDEATVIAPNIRMQAYNHLGEDYVAGGNSSGVYMDTLNLDTTAGVSKTRNLFAAPRSKFIGEYNGSLWAINAQVNVAALGGYTAYPDRAYKSSPPTGAVTFIKADQTINTGTIKVDSVRYLKPGMEIDLYTARTDTRTYFDLTINTVDKINNAFTVNTLLTYVAADVNTGADTIAVLAGNNPLQTGVPVLYTSASSATPLVSGTVYYVIRATSTTIKLATTLANATAGTAIDITATGTGGTLGLALTALNRDEIWGTGRKGLLSVYWNTDYPTTESADFIRIPQGKDDFAEFTGWAKTTARFFLFTRNSFYKYDGANFIPVSTTIGALSHEAIQVIGNWIIFPHFSGLYGYNDSTGQLQLLSRGIKSWFKAVPTANWATASAGVYENVYKLQVGTIGTYKGTPVSGTLRFLYDFDSNNFSTEFHTRQHMFCFLQVYNGDLMLHFADDLGNVFVDEVGNTDNGVSIPFEIEQGRENFTIDEVKNYLSAYVYTESPRGANVSYSLDGGDWKPLGELKRDVQRLEFPDGARGNDINIKITQDDEGDPISVIMVVVNFNTEAQSYQ